MSATEREREPSLADAELEALRGFLYDHVENLEELAVLAAVQARRQSDPLEVAAIVRATDLPRASVEEAVQRLERAGMLTRAPAAEAAFACAERDQAFTLLLERAIAEYRQNPLTMMGLMTANAIDRVRGAARRRFGESLRGKEPKETE